MPLQLLFVYGSLRQGFPNKHVNASARIAGQFRTCDRFRLFLLGAGEVPCLVMPPGGGYQVIGEVYSVPAGALSRMDKLDRSGEEDGYERVGITVERIDSQHLAQLQVQAYIKQDHRIPPSVQRIGPLPEYTLEHAKRFHWRGAD